MDMAAKVFAMIMLKRFKEARDERTRENQCEFRRERWCTDQIFTPRLIFQQYERYNLPIINMFLDFVAAFDSVTCENLWRIMAEDGMPVEFVELLKASYKHCRSIIRVLGEENEPFSVESGVKQGCILSPVLFIYCIDWILERAFPSFDGDVMGFGINVLDLDYADDIDAFAADPATAQAMLNEIAHFSQLLGMKIDTAKTKVMDKYKVGLSACSLRTRVAKSR
ncbi:hypothetical protein QYM36_014169 [Artemia franciscana]|uniref:Reverse transcriptase domain-containing protein n=1 Tax=Artemia franciscana TaxID=6661 RepID=A0AA88HMT2_ARTSF|nr:hypothetical protein QYM36_014169 [Artemia franciscana]